MSDAQKTSPRASVFLLRRLQSLLAVVPLGAFVIQHVFTNAIILIDPEQYDAKIAALRATAFADLFAWVFVLLPLALYFLIGLYFLYGTRSNVGRYRHAGNVRYLLQQVSAVLALAFLGFHIWQTRAGATDATASENLAGILAMPGLASLYLIGSTATIYHFCTGFWYFLTTWGITVSRTAQKRALVFTTVVFVILGIFNGLTVLKLSMQPGDDSVAVAE